MSIEPWVTSLFIDLTAHLAESLNEYVDEDVRLVSVGLEVGLVAARSGRAYSTLGVTLPATFSMDRLPVYVERILSDLQDLVMDHVHTPWPTSAAGGALHPWSQQRQDVLVSGFGTAGETVPQVLLRDFRIPAQPTSVRSAG